MCQIAWGTDRQQIKRPVFRGLADRENLKPIGMLLVLAQQGFKKTQTSSENRPFRNQKNRRAGAGPTGKVPVHKNQKGEQTPASQGCGFEPAAAGQRTRRVWIKEKRERLNAANVSGASRFAYLINEKTEFRSQEAEHKEAKDKLERRTDQNAEFRIQGEIAITPAER